MHRIGSVVSAVNRQRLRQLPGWTSPLKLQIGWRGWVGVNHRRPRPPLRAWAHPLKSRMMPWHGWNLSPPSMVPNLKNLSQIQIAEAILRQNGWNKRVRLHKHSLPLRLWPPLRTSERPRRNRMTRSHGSNLLRRSTEQNPKNWLRTRTNEARLPRDRKST